ncbi:MAG: M56 family peptidase [Acidimicrobiales bacterium]|nr:MAG: M56 family peptidase [Acidimicrobiales bacterium]
MGRTRQRRREAAVPNWAASHWFNHRGIEVRCIPTASPMAFAVPGRDPHVVVSEGLLSRLTEHQVNALIAHEAAHVRLRHDRHLLAQLVYLQVCGWLPGMAWVASALHTSVEQWADSDAVHGNDARPSHLCTAIRLASELSCRHGLGVSRSELAVRDPDATSKRHGAALIGLVGSLLAASLMAVSHSITEIGIIAASLH